ncbi:MAG: GNAT family N-acetyltransferase [Pseudomonadales bacterium]
MSFDFLSAWFASYGDRDLRVAIAADQQQKLLFGVPIERVNLGPLPAVGQLQVALPSIVPRLTVDVRRLGSAELADFVAQLLTQERGHRMLFEHVPQGSSLAQHLRQIARSGGCYVHESEGRTSPFVDVARPIKDMYDGYSRSTRYWLRRSANRLIREGDVEICKYDTTSIQDAHFDEAVAVSKASWKGPMGSDMAGTPGSLAMYRALCFECPFENIALWLLRLNGKAIAMQFHLVDHGTAYLLRSDFSQSHQHLSPGVALLRNILENYCEDAALVEFDLCGQAYEYKQKIASGYRRHCTFKVYKTGLASTLANLFYRLKGSSNTAQSPDEPQRR